MPNSESSVGVHSRFVFPILMNPEPYFPFVFIRGYPALLAPFLDQLDFVALRRVDKSDDATGAGFGWAVGEGITFGFSLFGECLDIVHLKCQMGQVGTDLDRSALAKFAELELGVTSGQPEKYQLRTARRGVTPGLSQSEHVTIKSDPFFPGPETR